MISGWLILLLTGFVFAGTVHLLLLGAIVIFPWRVAKDGTADGGDRSSRQASPPQAARRGR